MTSRRVLAVCSLASLVLVPPAAHADIVVPDPNRDKTKPVVEISAPAEGAKFTSKDAVEVVVAASDPDSPVTEVTLEVDGKDHETKSSPPFEWKNLALAEGTHQLRARAKSDGGVAKTAGLNVAVFADAPAKAPSEAPASDANPPAEKASGCSVGANGSSNVLHLGVFILLATAGVSSRRGRRAAR